MRNTFLVILSVLFFNCSLHAQDKCPSTKRVTVVGGGIIGALESYYAYKEGQNQGSKIIINVYEKGESFDVSPHEENGKASTNTSYNIVPSLTIDEILSVVPRGEEMVRKLSIPFSEPGGIRVDDVEGVNDSKSALQFKEAVTAYGSDPGHEDRTDTLLRLGRKSMDLWQSLYDEADLELKAILEASNFNPCREQKDAVIHLHDGYRIDLIYGIREAEKQALSMKESYEKFGYKNCKLLTPKEVISIDPFLTDYCVCHSSNNKWNEDSAALWRPGGCIDTKVFLPLFYDYLKKTMGCYVEDSIEKNCFSLNFGKEVIAVELGARDGNFLIMGLTFKDGEKHCDKDSEYVFCSGEAVGTLEKLGFSEPAYAGFAGVSLMLNIPLNASQEEAWKNFSHCMEVHNEGVVLAWQARRIKNSLFIGVAGTKAFYGDKIPHKDEAFARNRNLVQLNMINQVIPEALSLALGFDTKEMTLKEEHLLSLEEASFARRWAGRRSLAYDGFPTFGFLYANNKRVDNARCTTHLGSGGVSFAPASVYASRQAKASHKEEFIEKVLHYSDSRR
ncbi:FAD-binding oxidoreductase [Criblamydia sequanensis]|uniref:Secreted protein n=1 Tax=Candidatus Criblamydia sequanensis CRIB-18 TaxID=1437425 RepID=A0A090E1Z6_9BACT|nr:FAD-binding oxidoreductase [Criblamydia sequanensis]CDR34729.1 putative secreted protein [Criblamydia sequanensis CRIB-18]